MADKDINKVLNPLDVLVTAFGAMIGWGWVVSTGDWLFTAGVSGTIIGFILGGILIFLVGLTYSELMTAMPKNGGVLLFSYRAFGHTGSFICSWFMVFSYIGVVCFEACSISTVLQYIIPGFLKGYLYTVAGFDIYITWLVVAILAAALITYINIIGIKAAAIFQTILTIVIASVGMVLVVSSAFKGNIDNVRGQLIVGDGTFSCLKNILSIAVISPFFLFGFDVIPQVAEEINVSLKKIGKLMLLSIILAVLFYALIVFAVGYIMSPDDILSSLNSNELITAKAMERAFSSESMAKILILGGICGIVTSWNSFLIGGSRAIYSMAEAKMLPSLFGKLHPVYKTPVNAILLIGLFSVISVFLGRSMLVWIANTASFACCIAYCMVSIAFLVLRKRNPEMTRPYKVKYYRIVGLGASVLSAVMSLLYLLPGTGCTFIFPEWCIAIVWSVLGIMFALISRRKYGTGFGSLKSNY